MSDNYTVTVLTGDAEIAEKDVTARDSEQAGYLAESHFENGATIDVSKSE